LAGQFPPRKLEKLSIESNKEMSTSSTQPSKPLAAIILAAGKGMRMDSDLPKVLHQVAGKPMVQWVIDAVNETGADRVILVIGHGAQLVKETISGETQGVEVEYVLQEPQRGTGHAVLVCKDTLNEFEGNIVILGGDGPLLRSSTIRAMINRQGSTDATATLATSTIPDPSGYGRIVRDEQDRFEAIVEQKNATPEQLEIQEVYPSYAIVESNALWECLDDLQPNALTNEYYFTEVPRMLLDKGLSVEVINSVAPEDILSINTPQQLAEVETVLLARLQNEMEPIV